MNQHAEGGDDKDETYSSNGGDESLSHPLNDPEEQQVLLAALDSYRYGECFPCALTTKRAFVLKTRP